MPGASVNSISVKLRRAGTISPDVFYPAIILMCANNVLQKSLAVKVRLPSQYSDRCAPGKMPVGTDARGRIYCDFDYRILLQGNNAATTWISMVKHGQPRIVGRRRLVLLAPVLFRLAASVRPGGPIFCRLRLLFLAGAGASAPSHGRAPMVRDLGWPLSPGHERRKNAVEEDFVALVMRTFAQGRPATPTMGETLGGEDEAGMCGARFRRGQAIQGA